MDTLDDIAKDLDEMAATLDRVDGGEWADTPADIAEIYRNYARRIRSCADNFIAPSGGAPEARKSRRQEGKPTPANS